MCSYNFVTLAIVDDILFLNFQCERGEKEQFTLKVHICVFVSVCVCMCGHMCNQKMCQLVIAVSSCCINLENMFFLS